MSLLNNNNTGVTIEIKVAPRSSRQIIKRDKTGSIKAYLNSPPVDGKANKECISLFSKKLKIPKSNISIIKGEKGKLKTLRIIGVSLESINEIIS